MCAPLGVPETWELVRGSDLSIVGRASTSGVVAERPERGLFFRSVAPVAEWLRWDGKGGIWGGWRWGSPQDRTRRASEGYTNRTAPAEWCHYHHHHAPSMAQIAPLISGQNDPNGQTGIRSGNFEIDRRFLGLEGVRRDSEGEVKAACFGQVSRRLGRLLKRLPKSRSWSDSLRILRRSASNGSLLPASGRTGQIFAMGTSRFESSCLMTGWRRVLGIGQPMSV